jgi:hypothetical protein
VQHELESVFLRLAGSNGSRNRKEAAS